MLWAFFRISAHRAALAGLSSALAFPLDLGARPLCRRLPPLEVQPWGRGHSGRTCMTPNEVASPSCWLQDESQDALPLATRMET